MLASSLQGVMNTYQHACRRISARQNLQKHAPAGSPFFSSLTWAAASARRTYAWRVGGKAEPQFKFHFASAEGIPIGWRRLSSKRTASGDIGAHTCLITHAAHTQILHTVQHTWKRLSSKRTASGDIGANTGAAGCCWPTVTVPVISRSRSAPLCAERTSRKSVAAAGCAAAGALGGGSVVVVVGPIVGLASSSQLELQTML